MGSKWFSAKNPRYVWYHQLYTSNMTRVSLFCVRITLLEISSLYFSRVSDICLVLISRGRSGRGMRTRCWLCTTPYTGEMQKIWHKLYFLMYWYSPMFTFFSSVSSKDLLCIPWFSGSEDFQLHCSWWIQQLIQMQCIQVQKKGRVVHVTLFLCRFAPDQALISRM